MCGVAFFCLAVSAALLLEQKTHQYGPQSNLGCGVAVTSQGGSSQMANPDVELGITNSKSCPHAIPFHTLISCT